MASIDPPQSPLPRRLTDALERAGLSQKRLGTMCGIDPSVASSRINHYCVGRHTPTYALVERFAEALKVPVAYFYCSDDALATLIVAYASLPAASRSKLSKMAGTLSSAAEPVRKVRNETSGPRSR